MSSSLTRDRQKDYNGCNGMKQKKKKEGRIYFKTYKLKNKIIRKETNKK
jgi:hypothetical protein